MTVEAQVLHDQGDAVHRRDHLVAIARDHEQRHDARVALRRTRAVGDARDVQATEPVGCWTEPTTPTAR
jgi:hypothetical protein